MEKKSPGAVMRMFERDKDELRAFGILIETVPTRDESEPPGYRLDRKGFYLPYLHLAAGGGKPAVTARKLDTLGFRALASLVFEPDELVIIAEAAARVRALGDPVLAEEAESAIRKLSFDLPIPPVADAPPIAVMASYSPMRSSSHQGRDENVFEILNDALTRKKVIVFDYHTMSTDQIARREVEPYGMFFLSTHWYLAGRDRDRQQMRNFRLNRMRNVRVNPVRSQSADFEIPADFNLREHARSRVPWDLGYADQHEAIVDFSGESGATRAAARLGVSIEGSTGRRKFRFRRMDSFARWLLSFGGEAVPVSPESLVDEYNRQVRATQAVYENAHA